MVSLREYRKWQKQHPNFMTPHIVRLFQKGNAIVEVSEGTGFEGKKIYGVSKIYYKNGTFSVALYGNKMKHTLSEAMTYAKKLLKGI